MHSLDLGGVVILNITALIHRLNAVCWLVWISTVHGTGWSIQFQ